MDEDLAVATIRDVAEHTGLSPATVSRALSGHPYVDAQTRTRVLGAAQALDYRPNALARALRVRQTLTIGLIIPDIRNDFFAESATVLQGELEARGYRLILCISNGDPASDRNYVQTLAEHRVDGIVHVPCSPETDHAAQTRGRHIPVVELLRHTPDAPHDAIVSDDREGAAALTRHLTERGHRRIAMLTGSSALSTTRYRVEGYRDALRLAGIPPSEERVTFGSYGEDSGYAQTRAAFAGDLKPTAIFSSGSPLTSGAMRALGEMGLKIPRDVSVVGYEDPEWYAVCAPALTCYSLPLREMGRVAAELIVSRVTGEAAAPAVVRRFSGQLIVRASTAAV